MTNVFDDLTDFPGIVASQFFGQKVTCSNMEHDVGGLEVFNIRLVADAVLECLPETRKRKTIMTQC